MNKKINKFISEEINELEVDHKKIDNMIGNYLNYCINDESKFFIKTIGVGSYGKIYEYSINNKDMIVKKPKYDLEEDINASKAEAIISSVLSAFQYIYLKNCNYFSRIVPKVYGIYNDKKSENKNIIMEKFKGDVFSIFHSLDFNNQDNILLLYEFLYQVSCHLYVLQKFFKFMHNDLKTNNVLYNLKDDSKPISSENILFVLTDFGGSALYFDDYLVKGEVKGNELYYNKAKDIFILVHVIITYAKNKQDAISFFKDFFGEIDENCCFVENNKWHKIYSKKEYPKQYEPKNVLKKLLKKLSID